MPAHVQESETNRLLAGNQLNGTGTLVPDANSSIRKSAEQGAVPASPFTVGSVALRNASVAIFQAIPQRVLLRMQVPPQPMTLRATADEGSGAARPPAASRGIGPTKMQLNINFGVKPLGRKQPDPRAAPAPVMSLTGMPNLPPPEGEALDQALPCSGAPAGLRRAFPPIGCMMPCRPVHGSHQRLARLLELGGPDGNRAEEGRQEGGGSSG